MDQSRARNGVVPETMYGMSRCFFFLQLLIFYIFNLAALLRITYWF